MSDINYEELVDGTIDDVKEAVEDGADPAKVLEAEQANKDRVTLTDWLQEQISTEEQPTAAPTSELPQPYQAAPGPFNDWRAIFAAGIIIGALAIAAVFSTSLAPVTQSMSNPAAADDVRSSVQTLMNQQLERQRQQFTLIASQSPNISAEDLSISATVTDVTESEFGSLYKVTVVLQGQMPAQTGGLQQVDQEQVLYVSQDGRYLFPEPTDLEQLQTQQPSLQ